MLEEAVHRAQEVVGAERVFVATSAALFQPVVDASVVAASQVIAEPDKRNTLGCLCWLAANLLARGLEDSVAGVLTADHRIEEPRKFAHAVSDALDLAEAQDGIVTLGIPPDRPETGYGYIEADHGNPVQCPRGRTGYRSLGFREKPDLATAEQFVADGNFLWNGGMFFFTLERLLAEIGKTQPEALALIHEMADALRKHHFLSAAESFLKLPSISFDYAVMEKAERVFVIPTDFPWDDVGSWDSLDRSFPHDESGNVVRGGAVVLESNNSIVVNDAENEIKVGVYGVEDLIVVVTKDAVLVCKKDQAQQVREITKRLPKS